MEKRSVPLRHSGLIPYFNTFRVVLKCILATLGSHSNIALRPDTLFQPDRHLFGGKRPLQNKRIGELVAQCHGTIRNLGRQPLNHRSMPPGQKTVQIPERRIKLVIPFRANAYQMKPDARHPADPLRQAADSG